MKYIKTSLLFFLLIIIVVYYQLNENNNSIFEDKLSMFIFIKDNKNIENILIDLEKQIESFDEYVYNVYYAKDVNFLINNKLNSQYDEDYIRYKELFNSNTICAFNLNIGNLIEDYFLDTNLDIYDSRKYLLRDFLIRLSNYINSQITLFDKENSNLDTLTVIEDFIVGKKYFKNKDYYMLRIEFIDLNAISNYRNSGLDSIFQSILNYNSKLFNSEVIFYDPSSDVRNDTGIDLRQYIVNAESIEEMINIHQDLILSDNVVFIESLYDYYFEDINYKIKSTVLDTLVNIDYQKYKESLLLIEEKLIELQTDDLHNDETIRETLLYLVGDGYSEGIYSKYIDSINVDSNYIINNLNRLFSYELRSLLERLDYSNKEFDINKLSNEVRKHLTTNDGSFKIRYLID